MDETKTQQDSSGITQDTSGKSVGSTSEQDRTYTKAEMEKAVNDALSTAGRDAKSITLKMEEANRFFTEATKLKAEVEAAQDKWQEEQDRAELEAASHNPDTLSLVKTRQLLKVREAEISRKEQELAEKIKKHEDTISEATKFKSEKVANEIATKHNVDLALLLEHTDGSAEKMEALAQLLPKRQQQAPPSIKADSGVTAGTSDISGMLPMEKVRRGLTK